ncbi:MAG TPA: hypothetical protein VFA20_32425 [Myxococcaceae bacterium]|nr:hypothetical protein [Myxococcaceae bacterium]
MDSTSTSSTAAQPEPELAARHERMGPNPWVGLVLAVVVGVLVFWILVRIRKAFGMK